MKTPQEIAEEIMAGFQFHTQYETWVELITSAIQSERDRFTAYRKKMLGVLEEKSINDCLAAFDWKIQGEFNRFPSDAENNYEEGKARGHNIARQKLIEADAEYFREK